MSGLNKKIVITIVLLAIALLLAILSGCGHMPISSMAKLNKVKFETTDANQLGVAVEMPKWIKMKEGGVKLTLGAAVKNSDYMHRETFSLVEDTLKLSGISNTKPSSMPSARNPTSYMKVYRLADGDIERFNTARGLILKLKSEGDTKGSLTIDTDACRYTKAVPAKALVSTYLKTSETKEFVPMLVDYDLMNEFKDEEVGKALPVC